MHAGLPAYVRACVRACMDACVHKCVSVRVCARVCLYMYQSIPKIILIIFNIDTNNLIKIFISVFVNYCIHGGMVVYKI